MRINNQINPPKHPVLRAAKRGAAITAGSMAAVSGLTFITNNDTMRKTISEYGGFGTYFKTFITGLAILSAGGAAAGALLHVIADKITPKKPPKAAN